MKILFLAELDVDGTSWQRLAAIKDLGHDVQSINTKYIIDNIFKRALNKFGFRHDLKLLQNKIIDLCKAKRFDVAYVEKGIFLEKKTIEALKNLGVYTVHFNPDNPFGLRRDYYWHRYLKAIPAYNLNLVPRIEDVEKLKRYGGESVELFPFTYDEKNHFAPENGVNIEKIYDVSFIGTGMDNRNEFFAELSEKIPDINIFIFGNGWDKLKKINRKNISISGAVYHENYRDVIWKSKIILGMVSSSNLDNYTTRTFEIPAMRGFFLAHFTKEQEAYLTEGRRIGAVFFNSLTECASMITKYINDEAARNQISENGYKIISSSSHGNRRQFSEFFSNLENRLKL